MWGILVFPLNVLLTGHDTTILCKALMLDAFCLISFKTIVKYKSPKISHQFEIFKGDFW